MSQLTPVFVEKSSEGIDERSGHYDEVLTDMSLAIQQDTDGFVCGRVFNHIPTSKASGKFASYPPEYQLRHGFRERPEGTESGSVPWHAKFDKSYSCTVYAAKMVIGKQLKANVTSPINPERDTLEVLVEHSLIFKDEMWVDAFFKAGVWAVDLVALDYDDPAFDEAVNFVPWDDYVNSNPILDVANQKDLFRQRTGKEANKLVIGRFVYTKLIHHPKILARVINGFSNSGANPAKANLATLASLFEVEEVVVAAGIHDTGNMGTAASPSFIAGKHALLVHSPGRTNLKKPMAGGHFCWTGYESGVNNMGVVIDKWYNRERKVWLMEMELAFGLEVIAASLGVFFGSCVS